MSGNSRCPRCGASRRPDELKCPFCNATGELDPTVDGTRHNNVVLAAFLVALGVGIGVSIFAEALGITLVLLVVFVPLLLMAVSRRGDSTGMIVLRVVLVLFLVALALVVLVGIACNSGHFGLGAMH